MKKFLSFKSKRKGKDGEEVSLRVKINVNSIMEAHEDYDPEGNRYLVVFLNNTRDVRKEVPTSTKNSKIQQTRYEKVVEQISYIIDDQEAIDTFFSPDYD